MIVHQLLGIVALLTTTEPAPPLFADALAEKLGETRAFTAKIAERVREGRKGTEAFCRARKTDELMCGCFHHAASGVAYGYRSGDGEVTLPAFDFTVPEGATVPAMYSRCAAGEEGAPPPEYVRAPPTIAPLPEWRAARKFLSARLHPTRSCDDGLRAIHREACTRDPDHRACVAFRAMVVLFELPADKPFCVKAQREEGMSTVLEMAARHEQLEARLGHGLFVGVEPRDIPSSRSAADYYRLLFIDGFTDTMLRNASPRAAFEREAEVLRALYEPLEEPQP